MSFTLLKIIKRTNESDLTKPLDHTSTINSDLLAAYLSTILEVACFNISRKYLSMEQQFLFTKVLKRTHITHQLNMPSNSLQFFIHEGQQEATFQAMDTTEQTWTFRCAIRREGPYPKPYLSKGWREFVRAKGLREEDRITFYQLMNPENGVGFKIVVKREEPVKLMGQELTKICKEI